MSAGAKVQAFKAVGEVVGDQVLAVDRNAIGMHHRRRVAWQDHAASAPIRPVLDQLGFTRDRGAAWGLAFRRGVFEISKGDFKIIARSEEHTSELQSLMRISYAVFCLKQKKNIHRPI